MRSALQPDRRNAMKNESWKQHGYDTVFNGTLIAAAIVGLLLAVIDGPVPQPVQVAKALVLAEARA
jgi:hypothetical protein